jgi:phage terminase small subunit
VFKATAKFYNRIFMPGPSKRPSHLKVISGTTRPSREPEGAIELPPLTEIPPVPDWLPNAHAVTEWNRLAPLLVANKLLAEADVSSFGHLCALHGKMVQLWVAGESPTGHMISQYNALAGAFGLSPAWRTKVKPIGTKDSTNKFAQIKTAPTT